MNGSQVNRRNFLATSGSVITGTWLSRVLPMIVVTAQAACSKRAEGADFVHLESLDAADLEAIAEQILPSDETPGAREAGVIWFIDAAMGGMFSAAAGPLSDGLLRLNAGIEGGLRFADLDWDRQKSVLQAIETTPFFNLVHFLTVAGMFALPGYGGNQDKLGWALIGFEDRHAWQPPFGFYDEAYTREKSS